jgi:HAD superfamily hydrolase (TIGR01509 family)
VPPRAVLFDFNGVIVNDEPVHLFLFQRVLKEEGLSLREEEYYAAYIGMDDRGCFRTVLEHHQAEVTEEQVKELVARKARYYKEKIQDGIAFFPGAEELIRSASLHCHVGVVSGALRSEIVTILERARLMSCFQVIVSADETKNGKPHPEGYLTALAMLNRQVRPRILASECLVIEDTASGVEAAHRAGMKCLAVTNSHARERLREAELVMDTLEGFSWDEAASIL